MTGPHMRMAEVPPPSDSTALYFVRHAHSVYSAERERERGLSPEGAAAAEAVGRLLADEGIVRLVSSPYRRAVQTLEPLAKRLSLDITLCEELRERTLAAQADFGSPEAFQEAKRVLFADPDFAYPGGESSREAQGRAVPVLQQLLTAHAGERIAIGTHGDILSLMLSHWDQGRFGWDFWRESSMPDVYLAEFQGQELTDCRRLWQPRPAHT